MSNPQSNENAKSDVESETCDAATEEAQTLGVEGTGIEDPESELSPLEKLEEEKGYLLDQLQRSRAEMANFRRRTADERIAQVRRTTSSIMREVIPVLDNLKMALNSSSDETAKDLEQLRQGLQMVVDQFGTALGQFGVEAVPTVGEAFDPTWHEALQQIESSEQPPGQIIEEFISGYRMGDELIRAAQVSVAKEAASASSGADSSKGDDPSGVDCGGKE